MNIGILSPSVYMSEELYDHMIFAPRDLVISLADGLVDRGHTVHFFTTSDVKSKAHVVGGDMDLARGGYQLSKLKHVEGEQMRWASFYGVKRYHELDLTRKCWDMAASGKLDVIHSYHDTAAHFFDGLTDTPVVYTLHDPLPQERQSLKYWLFETFKHHAYISISHSFEKRDKIGMNFIKTVHHGLDIDKIPASLGKRSRTYVSFVGRMVPEKGIEEAIEAASATGIAIKIATSDRAKIRRTTYFQRSIKPHLKKGIVDILGHMNDHRKYDFYGASKAFVFPLKWEEPFGMVMIEAMACGTPVVAYGRGSVPEIVRDGVTGFVVDENDDKRTKGRKIEKTGKAGIIEALQRIDEIDRAACRRHVQEKFSVTSMVEGYERVYEQVAA